MPKGWRILSAVSLGSATLCLIVALQRRAARERHLVGWAEIYSTNAWHLGTDVFDAINGFGPDAPRIFLRMLTSRESPLEMTVLSHIPEGLRKSFHFATLAGYRDGVDHSNCVRAYGLVALGSKAAPYIPNLVGLLHDRDRRIAYLSVFTLRSIGPLASNALPEIIKCLSDPDFNIRDDAVAALGTIHEQPERVCDSLERNRTNQVLRDDSIRALGQFGLEARNVAPVVRGFLQDTEAWIRVDATNALK